jgi:hypothetical protein
VDPGLFRAAFQFHPLRFYGMPRAAATKFDEGRKGSGARPRPLSKELPPPQRRVAGSQSDPGRVTRPGPICDIDCASQRRRR